MLGVESEVVEIQDEGLAVDGDGKAPTIPGALDPIAVGNSDTKPDLATRMDICVLRCFQVHEIVGGAGVKQSHGLCAIDGDDQLHSAAGEGTKARQSLNGDGGLPVAGAL
jgi:hypothetical protein